LLSSRRKATAARQAVAARRGDAFEAHPQGGAVAAQSELKKLLGQLEALRAISVSAMKLACQARSVRPAGLPD
jgi:hypothetical protein